MIYQAARWRKKPGGEGGADGAIAMINRAANKGDDISSDGLVRDFH